MAGAHVVFGARTLQGAALEFDAASVVEEVVVDGVGLVGGLR